MAEEKKDEEARDPIKILLEEALEKQRNAMMDDFAQAFNGYPPTLHLLPATTLEALLLLRYK